MKVSVLTPSFNSGKYLKRAINSVQQQCLPNIEHIVIDGGSTDNTIDILKSYPHIKWISEKDNGQADAMNKAFKQSSGDIIVYLNADDYFEADAFQKVINEFEADTNIDMVVGNGIKITEQGDEERWVSETAYSKCLQFYKYGFPLNPVSYFYKRSVQQHISYNVNNHYTMDYEFLLRAFQLFKVKYVAQIFGYFFYDGNNKTADAERAYQELKKTAIRHCLKYDFTKLFLLSAGLINKKCSYLLKQT